MRRLLFALFLLPTLVKGQFKYLVMEGSGIKAFAYVGALQELDKKAALKDVEVVGGTSGGAIIAALYAVGYTPNELEEIAYKVPLKKFTDKGYFWQKNKSSILRTYGQYKGDGVERWLEELIEAKTGDKNINFEQLYKKRKLNKFKELYIVATDLSIQKSITISHKYYSKMRIVDAVRASMSIPGFYNTVLIDSNGTRYRKYNQHKKLHVLVDGGLLNNFPVRLFDSSIYTNTSSEDVEQFNTNILGILLENEAFLGDNPYYEISNFSTYINSIYHTLIDKPLNEKDRKRTVVVTINGVSPMVKKIPKATMEYLIRQGRIGANDFLRSATDSN
jgi:NTE family protein